MMIENERQYRITKAQADKFQQALTRLAAGPADDSVHPLLHQAQIDGVGSQLTELRRQLAAYEALQTGSQSVLELSSFAELPQALIQARIAAGLSQQALAEKLGLKKQQIQQYETTRYTAASFQRIQQVIQALGIQIREDVFLPTAQVSLDRLLHRLSALGLDRTFVLQRFLPPVLMARVQAQDLPQAEEEQLVVQVASLIARVFNWMPSALFGSDSLSFDSAVLGAARFKVPARVDERRFSAHTMYAHYLALLVVEATIELPMLPLPTDAVAFRRAVLDRYAGLTLTAVTRYLWDLGIPILPLGDTSGFHGACWRVRGRNVVVLTQHTPAQARWLFDLLHEYWHATQEPQQAERSTIEAGDITTAGRETPEEYQASKFAEDVLFAGQADALAKACVTAANGSVERLKSVVPRIAAQEEVDPAALANYMAYRLQSQEGPSWWGAATNLQQTDPHPWQVVRDVALERLSLHCLNEMDRRLLMRAFAPAGGTV